MNPRQLRAFVAVAQSLSFANASERLHLSQPALSLSIKNLEESLGGRLLVRTTRAVSLTPEGEILLSIAPRLLADWDNTEELMRQHFTLQRGKVVVAAMPSFASSQLSVALKVFRERYPRIDVAVHDVINEQMLEMVRAGRVEFGIGFEPVVTAGIDFTELSSDRFVAVVPADSPLAGAARVTWAGLLAEPFIALQRPSAVRLLLEQSLEQTGRKLRVSFECHQLATVGRMVACGLGVSAVPALSIAQMEELGARCLPLAEPTVSRGIGIVSLERRELSSATRALRKVILEVSGSGGAGQEREDD